MRVVVDGQITGSDGISRYTHCLTRALAVVGTDIDLHVIPAAGVPRYSFDEGDHLLETARRLGADVLHLLDYRVPLREAALPVVATVHDIRLRDPAHCYSDAQFATRFGTAGLDLLVTATRALRDTAPWPPGMVRQPASCHEEFVGRMLSRTAATAARILTPTHAVAAEFAQITRSRPPTHVSPYGVEHLRGPEPALPESRSPIVADRYLLYVGQARPHKGVPALVEAFGLSGLAREKVRLVLVGRDFAPGTAGEALAAELGDSGVTVGEVSDAELAAWYGAAEGLVHLSEHEGFGLPPAEALSFGTRVIAADIPVLREVLGPHAWFVDPHEAKQTAAAMRRLIHSPDEPGGRAARRAWAGRYLWTEHAMQVLACYQLAAG